MSQIEQIVERMREAAEDALARRDVFLQNPANVLAVLSALKEAQELAAGHQKYIDILQGVRDKEDAAFAALRAEHDTLNARLEASEAEQARLIADLDGAKDAATVAYKEEIARLTAERATLWADLAKSRGETALVEARCDALAAALKEAGEALEPLGALAVKEVKQRPGLMAVAFLADFLSARDALASIKAAIGETS